MPSRISSPYVTHLEKGKIKWMPFNRKTLNYAIATDKIIFIHIGTIANIDEREMSFLLFEDEGVIKCINEHFVPILLDSEDVPEMSLIALDLLIINEQNFSIPINVFSLPNAKPFTSFNNVMPDEFIMIAQNIINSFINKRLLLEKAAAYMVWKLEHSGVVSKKAPPVDINQKLLHAYVKSWSERFISVNTSDYHNSPFTFNPRFYVFLIKYAVTYNKTEWKDYLIETLDKLYYSALFDPICGGFFSRSTDYTLSIPLYEKSFLENCQGAVLYAIAYKYFKYERYKECCQRTIKFINARFKSEEDKGYMTSISLNNPINASSYYKYSIREIQENFPDNYQEIAIELGMDLSMDKDVAQYIFNTHKSCAFSPEKLAVLKSIRKSKNHELIYDRREITADNCMYASTLCLVSNMLEESTDIYNKEAEHIINYILSTHTKDKTIKLCRYISSSPNNKYNSYLLDYAFLLNALLLLDRNTHNAKFDILSRKITTYIIVNYYRKDFGIFTATKVRERATPYQREALMDYTRFSANSVMARNLFILYLKYKKKVFLQIFEQQLYNVESQIIGSGPLMVGWSLQVLNYLIFKQKKLAKDQTTHNETLDSINNSNNTLLSE